MPQGEPTSGLGPITTGSLSIAMTGLPAGTQASVLVTNSQGFQQSVSATSTLSGLTPGTYSVVAAEVTANGDRFAPTPASQSVAVIASTVPATAPVAYGVVTGRLQLNVSGAPVGAIPSIEVTGPSSYNHISAGSELLTGLIGGSYHIVAPSLVVAGDRYDAEPAVQDVGVTPGNPVPSVASIGFAIATGRMIVTVSGLPGLTNSAIQVSGPSGYSRLVTRTDTLIGLTPGTYTILASPVTISGAGYSPNPASASLSVSAGTAAASASVSYALATGSLQVAVSGLPSGASASISVTGPQGFAANVTDNATLTGLVPGSYSIAAANTSWNGQTYIPAPASQSITVAPNPIAAVGSVVYTIGQGSLSVSVTGLPGGVSGSVLVTGPGGYSQSVAGSLTLTELSPGSYTLTASNVTSGAFTYVPAPPSQAVPVTVGATSPAAVAYSSSTGGLAVAISGLPGGSSANVTVTGPGGYTQLLTTSQTLTGLAPGGYTIAASSVLAGGYSYAGAPPSQLKTVIANGTAAASVSYTVSTGSLQVTISGLPIGVNASVNVSGPGGFSQSLTASQTLTGLAPGSYTVSAAIVVSGPTTYTPAPVSQSAAVNAGTTSSASVSYTGSGGGATLNLTVNGVYLTQATQKYDGSVPLVAGRNAYLRVFALANQANSAAAQVRVRLYDGVTLVQTYTIPAPAVGVPTTVNEGSLTSSWNVMVPGLLVQPNLRVLADVDPSGGIAESDDLDNQFPLSGTSAAVDVRSLPTFALRFVPVIQQVNGLQGNVSGASQESFLNDLKKLLPVGGYDADIRAPYSTAAPALQNDNANGAWGTILSELLTLRFTEGSPRYYYGVVKTTYSSGVAGIGYVGGSARTALGWDYLPSGSGVMAHELGHNMSRQHAPCGGVASPDPAFPYAGGKIGVWGLDLLSLTLKSPATYIDLMGYCSPVWVSDYNWSGMMTYRQSGPSNAPPAGAGAGQGLLVWGRITSTGVVLEPAFIVAAAPSLAPAPGPHRIDLQAEDGSVLRTASFAATEVADLPGGPERHFAFVLPMDVPLSASLGRLTVRANGRSATRLRAGPGTTGADPAAVVTRQSALQVELRWNSASYPMVMVRDAATGQVISFARGGSARVWTRGSNFELQFSDGVKSVVRRHTLQ